MTTADRKRIVRALVLVNKVISPCLGEKEYDELTNVRGSLKLALGYRLADTTGEIVELEK